MMFVFEEVFKEKRSSLSKGVDLRLQRALSWVKQAGQLNGELEAKLLYYWIGFNALYLDEIELSYSQKLQASSNAEILNFIFARITMLQTQMSLGGMVNRSQVFRQLIDSACQILTTLLPIFMYIMLEHEQSFDGHAQFFPVVHFS